MKTFARNARTAGVAALVVMSAGCGSSVETATSMQATAGGKGGYSERWSGGPFTISNPLPTQAPLRSCPASSDLGAPTLPVCDYYRLTPPASAHSVLVSIAPAQGFEGDDYDLYVYNDKGVLVSAQAHTGPENALFENTGSAWYEIRVQPYLVSPGSSYGGVAMQSPEQAFDVAVDCSSTLTGEDVPEAAGAAGVTDSGQDVELSVALMLDGTDAAVAQKVMERAVEAYKPLHIKLVLKQTQAVHFTSADSTGLIQEAKAEAGGAPPAGVDVQGVFTRKTMQSANSAGAGTVIGQADCIGGVRARNNAFFVISDLAAIEDEQIVPGAYLYTDATAETMAHEIGHLMGAQHHYANCVEGIPTSGRSGDVSPCTVMFPQVDGASLNFGTLETAVVRGHAVRYASP